MRLARARWASAPRPPSVSTHGSAAHRQQPDPASANRRTGAMKRIVCSLLVATVPFGSVLADAPKPKNKTPKNGTLVYQHELPNVPARASGRAGRIRPGRLPSAWSHASESDSSTRPVIEGEILSQVKRRNGDDLPGRTELLPSCPATRHSVSANASKTKRTRLHSAVFVVDTTRRSWTIHWGTRGSIPFVRRYCRGRPAEP